MTTFLLLAMNVVASRGAAADVEALVECSRDAFATQDEVLAAARRFAGMLDDDDLDIEDRTLVFHADEGYWVQAWLWVPE